MLTHDMQWHYSVPFQKCNIIEDPLNSLFVRPGTTNRPLKGPQAEPKYKYK